MPKPVLYKTNSVVYFQGDVDDRIYILKSGRVVLRSKDIETGQEINDLIQTGEFFGVKSSLGHFPREEDALVLSDAQVIQFSVPEFEAIAGGNTRIILKMLKVFSNQLRRLHSKVSSMLQQADEIDPEEGMSRSASFYFNNRQYGFARYIWTRYLELYPSGRHAAEARKQLERAGQAEQAKGGATPQAPPMKRPGEDLPDIGRRYFDGESLFANEKYDEAIRVFVAVAAEDDGEYKAKAQFQIGHCHFAKGDYATTIRHFSQLLKEVPRHPRMSEILFFIGAGYGRTGDGGKARTFLGKARAGAAEDPSLRRKIDKALAEVDA